MYTAIHVKVADILVRFQWNLCFREVFKSTLIKFHENLSIFSRDVPCGRKDGLADKHGKFTVAVRNIANEPRN